MTLTVAAAADLQPALREIIVAYERRTGTRISPAYGSSGSLATQIENGAPYDVFLSADMEYPQRLQRKGLAGSITPYASGTLALFTLKTSGIDFSKLGMRAVLAPEVRAIAIANPEHAPYGKAAVEALRRAGLYDAVRHKLVVGENVAQAAQFVLSGNAQVGIVSWSLVLTPEMKQVASWDVPSDWWRRVMQGAAVLKQSPHPEAAQDFLKFLKDSEAAAIFRRYGFEAPQVRP